MVVFGVDGFQGINWNDTEYHCILLYVTVFSGLLKSNHSVLIIGGNIFAYLKTISVHGHGHCPISRTIEPKVNTSRYIIRWIGFSSWRKWQFFDAHDLNGAYQNHPYRYLFVHLQCNSRLNHLTLRDIKNWWTETVLESTSLFSFSNALNLNTLLSKNCYKGLS